MKRVVFLLLIGGLLSLSYRYVMAASEKDVRSEIVEKAKKEGEVVLYTTMPYIDLQAITPAFEKKYPFLKAKFIRLRSATMFTKLQSEYRAKQYLADTVNPTIWTIPQYFDEGLLGAYKSPEREAILESFMDKDGYWTSDYIVVGGLAYNTKLVPPNRIPRSYQDLLDPWWKGRIGMDEVSFRWYGCMLKILGEEKGRAFMQKLSQQNANIRRNPTLITQLLAAGEFSAAINIPHRDVEEFKKMGGPVEWIAPLDQPIIMYSHVTSIAKNPPHPNAARLYIDFILSKEGQQVLAKRNVPIRPDIPSDLPRLMQGPDGKQRGFLAVDFDLVKRIALLQKEFNQLFLPKGAK